MIGKTVWICIGVILLASCGPQNRGGIAAQLGDLVVGAATNQEAPASGPNVSREDLFANPGKYLRVYNRARDSWDTNVQAGENGRRVTWIDSANVSLTLEDGIIVATRGLTRDLMAADVSQTWAAIRAGGGNSQRTHEFLDDLDGISTELLQCRIASEGPEIIEKLQKPQKTTRFSEECRGPGLAFTNVYWVGSNGRISRSLQAISADSGYLQIDVF